MTPAPQSQSLSTTNIPYVQLAPMAFTGTFVATHPPSTHIYQYYRSFDWPGFNAQGINTKATDILSCIKLSVLYDYNFFSYQNSTGTCHFKVPVHRFGVTTVFPTNVSIPCPQTGFTSCINKMSNLDFPNAFSVMDAKKKVLSHKTKDAKACAKLCFKNKNICAAATYSKGKCTFKQPVLKNDTSFSAGVIWFVRGQ
ncbi:UNVERIFIED_CONTAM: hypothetical protein HDU68_009528 [Siphonaria sp. JEL0065]|nr:hypothetical protein HDU68_009528 [Siphonaria sp. JEL0065]